ncbi:hypothetical protein BSKO_02904 [Bryopsis sp. KO-2023]|nr:hypothetical protein BSKO_02904 [Bryopsis sp. KO-2023]
MITSLFPDKARLVVAFAASFPCTVLSEGVFAAVETETLIWGVVALAGAIFVVCLIGVLVCCSSESSWNSVKPRATTEQNEDVDCGAEGFLVKNAKEGEISSSPGSSDISSIPVPPWESDPESEPPGIILSSQLQDDFSPSIPRTRRKNEIPYERLVIVSSRTRNADKIPNCALPNVAVLTYDWLRWTAKDLLETISRILSSTRVTSIAIVAPGEKPWQIELLHHLKTCSENLRVPTVCEFWVELATHVARDGDGHGGRIDLLGCRVSELHEHGAQLIMDLWTLTGIPVACSDDAMAGFPLYTFIHNPTSQDSKLVKSDVSVLDVYFNGKSLLSKISKPEKGALGLGNRSGSSMIEGSFDWDHLSVDLDSNALDMEAAMDRAMNLLKQCKNAQGPKLEPLEVSHYTGLADPLTSCAIEPSRGDVWGAGHGGVDSPIPDANAEAKNEGEQLSIDRNDVAGEEQGEETDIEDAGEKS